MKTIQPVCHEFAAELLYNEHGLSPWFGALSRIRTEGGSHEVEFTEGGDRWQATLYYQESNIIHPCTTPDGTTIQFEEIREPRVQVRRHPREDPIGEQKFNAHMRPRWQEIEAENREGERKDISPPRDFGEGVSIRLSGSNIDFHRYTRLLKRAVGALGIRADYFTHADGERLAHPYSSVQDAERYVRIHKDASGPIHGREGPIASMAHLLESDRQGVRELKTKRR